MREHATLLRPGPESRGGGKSSAALPPDLLEQVRGRVRLLTVLILAAFAFDLIVFSVNWIVETAHGKPPSPPLLAAVPFQWLNLTIVLASLALWWFAGRRALPASRLVSLGLVYEVIVCFSIAISSIWQHYLGTHMIPNLTWVPAIVIFFPLILPGPPRRMLAGAIVAALMPLLALWILDGAGKVIANADSYAREIVSAVFAVFFAYMGARVVYGLGREVAAAREMGSYQLEERLGEGGMGEVWKARHRMLARPAAIKIIRPSLARGSGEAIPDDVRQRFEREAQVIAGFRCPHTVVLFDYGVADGTLYYAMELLDGLDADTLVRKFGPIPPERAVYLLRQICHSLSEAQANGVVHRDIKPANIFVCRYGQEFDFVKVLDFGLAKTLDESGGAPVALTAETAVRGTPAFIAPEQALGGRALDHRADIYATGCVAYWLLTGELVFTGDTPMALVVHHARTPAPLVSSRSEFKIPEALDRLIDSCLAKDPDARPQTARDLSRRLAEIDGARNWNDDRAREWWATHMA